MMIHVAPSILSADFSNIEEEVFKAGEAGATFIHLDVMDGVFVPNKTFGPDLVAGVAPYAKNMVKDVHLMVADPMAVAKGFADAGADLITFHYESYDNDEKRRTCIEFIRSLGVKVGMSVKPNTPYSVLKPFLPLLDLVLIMTVEPGKGGQSFMADMVSKIVDCRKDIVEGGYDIYLEVDGGINDKTAKIVVDAGANVLVAGSYLYGHDDFKQRVKGLLEL